MQAEELIAMAEQVDPELARQAREALELERARRQERLESFAQSLKRLRDRAVQWRAGTGIEREWDEADDAYEGVDDANRGQYRVAKPSSPDGGYLRSERDRSGRSTVLLNITAPYVDAAAARIGDMLLPVDDTSWSLEPTPVPDGVPEQVSAPTPVAQAMPGGMPQQPQSSDVREMARQAQKQIEDWLVECQWHNHMRKVFDDAARLGTGVLKGPVPARRVVRKVRRAPDGVTIEQQESIVPESRWIPLRNVYPDPACGDDVAKGAYVWECDKVSAKQLRDMRGLPGYLDDEINAVLEAGPGSAKSGTSQECRDDSLFDVWYFTGQAEREDLEAAQIEFDEDTDPSVSAPCMVTLVEDRVVQAALSPLDTGDLPYDFMVWKRREGLPWGIGVAQQMQTPQRGLTAALRATMDNAGVSSGAQVVMNRNGITPVDGQWQIGGGLKLWWLNEGAEVNEVRKAFEVYTIPSLQAELMNIAQFYIKMAEDVTGIPQMMQGQLGQQAPDTFSGQLLLMNNAGALLRRVARLCDDLVTERHIRRYYAWLLVYGEDDAIKGDFRINARGSTAMVELALQNQFVQQMGQLVGNPAYGIDPEKWFAEMLKSQRIDPQRFTLDEEKKAQLAQQPPPQPPQVQVAQINAQSRQQVAQLQAQVDQQVAQMAQQASVEKMRIDTDRDAVYVQAQTARDQANAQARRDELMIKRELALLNYANREKVTLDKVKADLAKKAMEIQSVERLAGMKAPSELMPKPPIEPVGQAPAGESYQK